MLCSKALQWLKGAVEASAPFDVESFGKIKAKSQISAVFVKTAGLMWHYVLERLLH